MKAKQTCFLQIGKLSRLSAGDADGAHDARAAWMAGREELVATRSTPATAGPEDRVYEWEQTRSQGLLLDVDHPTLGRITLPGPPLRFDGAQTAGGRERHLPPPTLGQHDTGVRAWLDELETRE